MRARRKRQQAPARGLKVMSSTYSSLCKCQALTRPPSILSRGDWGGDKAPVEWPPFFSSFPRAKQWRMAALWLPRRRSLQVNTAPPRHPWRWTGSPKQRRDAPAGSARATKKRRQPQATGSRRRSSIETEALSASKRVPVTLLGIETVYVCFFCL